MNDKTIKNITIQLHSDTVHGMVLINHKTKKIKLTLSEKSLFNETHFDIQYREKINDLGRLIAAFFVGSKTENLSNFITNIIVDDVVTKLDYNLALSRDKKKKTQSVYVVNGSFIAVGEGAFTLKTLDNKEKSVELSDLGFDVIQVPVDLKYTANPFLNKMLALFLQPSDYNKNLSKFFSDNMTAIKSSSVMWITKDNKNHDNTYFKIVFKQPSDKHLDSYIEVNYKD